jgi:hypothetical protein
MEVPIKALGTYYDTIPNSAGCDSLMTLNLTINQATSSTQSITMCDSFLWNGNTYKKSGTYYDTIPNSAGCDSSDDFEPDSSIRLHHLLNPSQCLRLFPYGMEVLIKALAHITTPFPIH